MPDLAFAVVTTVATKTTRRRVPGAHLRAAREAFSLSQEDLSKLLDVRGPTISERENAETVSWETWLAWAMVLGLPATWKPGDPVPQRPQ